jgi:proton glutamate symport protein
MAVIFCAQINGLELGIGQQVLIMLALMLTSKGMAGVPRVALIVLAGTLASFHIPIIGVAILLGIDQILDMGRTTVNLIGNCVATVVIARWENCFDYDKMNNFIKECDSEGGLWSSISRKAVPQQVEITQETEDK